MVTESKTLLEMLNRYTVKPTNRDRETFEAEHTSKPGYSFNLMPGMIIFLLGIILGGHHQMAAESTMMHKLAS